MDIRLAAYCVIIRDNQILLSHWNEAGHQAWTLPGGGLEEGEDPKDAAIREVREETGYEVELGKLIGIDSKVVAAEDRLRGEKRPMHALRMIYLAEIIGGTLQNEVNGSTDEAAWFDLDNLQKLNKVPLIEIALSFANEEN